MASDTSSALMNEHFSCGKNRTQCLVGVHICDVKSSMCLTQKEIGSGEVITHEVIVKEECPIVNNTVQVKTEASQFSDIKITNRKNPKTLPPLTLGKQDTLDKSLEKKITKTLVISQPKPKTEEAEVSVDEMSDDDDDIMEEVNQSNQKHTFDINKKEVDEEESDDEDDMDEQASEPMAQKMKFEPLPTKTQKSSLPERPKIPPIKPSKSQPMTFDESFTVCAFDNKEGETQLKSLFDEISREKTVSYKEKCDSNENFQERICVDPFSNMFSLKVHNKDLKRFDEVFSDKCRLP